jgi:hypothetical protein
LTILLLLLALLSAGAAVDSLLHLFPSTSPHLSLFFLQSRSLTIVAVAVAGIGLAFSFSVSFPELTQHHSFKVESIHPFPLALASLWLFWPVPASMLSFTS